MTRMAIIFMCLILSGCAGGKSVIGEAARRIRAEATATKADLQAATDTGEVGPLASPFIEAASKRQDLILSETERVNQGLSKVEDKTPYWLQVVGRAVWGIAALALLALLIYFLPLIRPIMAGIARALPTLFGWLIPARTRDEAEMDAKAIAAGEVTEQHQIRRVETRKQTDPMYRAALKIEQAKIQPSTTEQPS